MTRLLVLGAGVSGSAAARLGREAGYSVTVFDDDPAAGADLVAAGVSFVGGRWSSDLLEGMDAVVVSPGIPERALPITEAIESRVPVWSEIEFASRFIEAPLVAVTGTNGKTTVTRLIADMISTEGRRTVAAGNIGLALSDVALRRWDVVVVEASSFQLRFIEDFHPAVAVVLNVADDHLDWHGSRANYLAAKRRITENQSAGDLYVFDRDDEGAATIAATSTARTVGVSGVDAGPDGIGLSGDRLRIGHTSLPVEELAVADRAYLVDLAAAAAAAGGVGVPESAVAEVVRAFRPGAHRRSVVGVVDGVQYVDDSKGTNPHAALAAIEAYPSVVLIAGGRNKDLDVRPLARAPNVRHLIAIGEAAGDLVAAATMPATEAASMADAVAAARRVAGRGDVVLLSPGCASFDMFSDYRERGRAFAAAVADLEGS